MDIFTLITKQLSGINPLGAGFVMLCFIVLVVRIKLNAKSNRQDEKIEEIKKYLKEQMEKIENTILGFMKEVNESIKDERKLTYSINNSIDREIKNILKDLHECIGELRGKKNDNG